MHEAGHAVADWYMGHKIERVFVGMPEDFAAEESPALVTRAVGKRVSRA